MAESKVKKDNYIVVQGWMITDLKLKGNELIIYACIYGFSQTENQVFSGSLQYLADWTNSTKQSVIKCLKSLEAKRFICKNENYINGVKFCEYYATNFNGVLNNVYGGGKQSLTGGIKQSLPNSIDLYNDIDKKENKYSIKEHSRFIPPTVDEVTDYCNERQNGVDPERFVDYYTANGWRVGKNSMKDWKAAVRTWERSGISAPKQTTTRQPRGVIDDMRELYEYYQQEEGHGTDEN